MALPDYVFVTGRAVRCRQCGIVIGFGERCEICRTRQRATDRPGEYQGRHHTEWMGTVQVLLEEDDLVEAEVLLRRLMGAARAEAKELGTTPVGWYEQRLRELETTDRSRFHSGSRPIT